MSSRTINETYEYQLRTVYNSETALVTAYTRLMDRATAPALQAAIQQHLADTQTHTQQLQRLLPNTSDSNLDPQLAEEVVGLVNEVAQIVPGKRAGAATDSAVIDVTRQMLHFEIAAYSKLSNHAGQLHEQEHQQQFEAILARTRDALNRLEQHGTTSQNGAEAATEVSATEADTFQNKGAVEEEKPRQSARQPAGQGDHIDNINEGTSLDGGEKDGVDNIEGQAEIREDLKNDSLGGSTQLHTEKPGKKNPRGVIKS